MEPDRHYYRLLARLRKVAETETAAILARLPDECKERVEGLAFSFHDRPSPQRLEQGIDPDRLAFTDGPAGQIHVFLMNLHDRYGKVPGDFRQELQRVLGQEIAEWMGVEMEFGE